MGSLASRSQLETVEEHVEDAVSKGAEVLAGGRARPDIGPYFYEPTLLGAGRRRHVALPRRDVRPGRRHLALQRRGGRDRRAPTTATTGSTSRCWTRDTQRGLEIGSRLQAGTVNVNEGYISGWASVDAPMGGMKASGLGRRHGARRHHEVHRAADRRRSRSWHADRAAAGRAIPAVGEGDDALASAAASHAGHPLTYGGRTMPRLVPNPIGDLHEPLSADRGRDRCARRQAAPGRLAAPTCTRSWSR